MLSFKITKKSAFTENQTCQRPIKVCRNLWKKGMQFWKNVIWSDETKLQVIHGRINGSRYREILEKNLQKSATSLGHFVIQHDNDPKHTAKLTKEWFENNGISTLNWPSQFPDLNPNENLWKTLKVKVHKRNPQNIKQLEELCKEESDWKQ